MSLFPVRTGMKKFICVQCAKSVPSGKGEEHDGSSVQECSACKATTNVGTWIDQRYYTVAFVTNTHASRYEDRIRDLANEIGFGRIMQLCEKLWREEMMQQSLAGGELTVGPAAKFVVPCPCGADEKCEWCCGSGQVTDRVREAMTEPLPLLLWCPGCGERHVDGEDMKPHKTHACQHCGMNWRPANVPTHGVQFLPGCKD